MKVRLGFVTNSSSSSFIIAVHKDCTREDIRKLFENLKTKIKKYLSDFGEYYHFFDEKYDEKIESLLEEFELDEAAEVFIDAMTDSFFGYAYTNIDPWAIVSTVCGNGGEYVEDDFLYWYGKDIENSDKFKLIWED